MNVTQVRVEIQMDLYSKLKREQEKQCKILGKKPALSCIILEFCKNWSQVMDNTEVVSGLPIPEIQKPKPPEPVNGQPPMTSEQLINWEKRLRNWDGNLRGQAFTMIEKDQTVSEKAENVLTLKEEALEILESAQKKNIEIEILKTINNNLTREIAEKNEQISKFRKDFQSTNDNIIKLLKSIDHKTEKTIFMDYIVPFLPVLATVINGIILKKDISGNKDLNSFEKDISDLYNGLKPDIKEGFIEHFKNIAQDYIKNTKGKKYYSI